MRGIARDNTVKRSFARSELVGKVQTHLLQRTDEDKIESAPTIDKNPSKLDLCDHGIQHQWELPRLGKAGPLIITGK
jgi:hypothetical protein